MVVTVVAALVSSAMAEQRRVRVAVPAPLAGLQARNGVGVHVAADIVAAEINAGGGVVGRPIELFRMEDPCSSQEASRVADVVAALQLDAVIGFPCRSTALAVAPALGRSGPLSILTAAQPMSSVAPRAGPTVFHMSVAVEGQGAVIASRLIAAGAAARIALVRDQTAQAIALGQSVERALREAGRGSLVVGTFKGGDKSFSAIAERVRALGVTHVALIAFPVEGALIASELVAAIPEIEILGPDFLSADVTPTLAGVALARMRIVRAVADPYGAGLEGRRLMGRLTAQGVEASREALVVATAIEAWAVAAGQASSIAPAAVAAVLSRGVETRFGRVTFDARGQSVVAVWGW